MANLLPQIEKRRVRREYLTRLTTMALTVLAVVATIGAVLLLPSYFLTESRGNVVAQQVEVVTQAIETRSRQENTNQILKDTREKLQAVQVTPQQYAPIIRKIVAVTSNTISIRSFFVVAEDGVITLTLRGIAENRDELVELQGTLQSFDQLAQVELPVSNLAQSQNISFSMTMRIIEP